MVSAIIRGARDTADTVSSTQDFTVPGIGTPSGALVIVTFATSLTGTAANERIVSIGVTDGTNHRGIGIQCEHNQASTDTDTVLFDNAIVRLSAVGGGSFDAVATFNSWITDGIRLNWTNSPGSAFVVDVILWAGDDITVAVGDAEPDNGGQPAVDVDIGFEPDHFISFGGSGNTFDESFYRPAQFFLAQAINTHPITGTDYKTRSMNWGTGDSQTTDNPTMLLRPNGFLAQPFTASPGPPIPVTQGPPTKIDSFYSDGFRIWTDAASGKGPRLGFIAIAYGGKQYDLKVQVAPTSAGTKAFTGYGFKPGSVLALATISNNGWGTSNLTNEEAGTQGIALWTLNEEFCSTGSVEDAAGTTNTQSADKDRALSLPLDDGSGIEYEATLDSFDSDGYTLDFTTVQSDRAFRFLAFALEADDITVVVPLGDLRLNGLAPTVKVRPVCPLGDLRLNPLDPTPRTTVHSPLGELQLNPLDPQPRTRVVCPLGDLRLDPLDPTLRATVHAPVGDLRLNPLDPTPRGRVVAPLGELELNPLSPTLRHTVHAPLGDLRLNPLAPTVRPRIVVPLGELQLNPLAPGLRVQLVSPLGELELNPLAPTVRPRIVVPLGELLLNGIAPVLIRNVKIVVPLGALYIQGFDPVAVGAVMLTNKKRIYDAMLARIKAASFIRIAYDNDTCILVEGAALAPETILFNDTKSTYTPRAKRNRRSDFQERSVWSWELRLDFHQEVTTELFETDLLKDPIVLPRDDANGLDGVRLVMQENIWDPHPPQQEPSNGTRATYKFVAELSPQ